ncbi:unnamed protein product, partial [Cyclocybe aegerita]
HGLHPRPSLLHVLGRACFRAPKCSSSTPCLIRKALRTAYDQRMEDHHAQYAQTTPRLLHPLRFRRHHSPTTQYHSGSAHIPSL